MLFLSVALTLLVSSINWFYWEIVGCCEILEGNLFVVIVLDKCIEIDVIWKLKHSVVIIRCLVDLLWQHLKGLLDAWPFLTFIGFFRLFSWCDLPILTLNSKGIDSAYSTFLALLMLFFLNLFGYSLTFHCWRVGEFSSSHSSTTVSGWTLISSLEFYDNGRLLCFFLDFDSLLLISLILLSIVFSYESLTLCDIELLRSLASIDKIFMLS